MCLGKRAWFWPVLALGGCVAGYPPELASPDPAARIRAIRQIAEKRDPRAVPLLVDRLEDEDEAVRFYAIAALVRITGTDRGYKYYRTESERLEAVRRWRGHVQGLSAAGPTTQEAPATTTAAAARDEATR